MAACFKCGPLGGQQLNRFRDESKGYINVAHDDPDANEFLIAMGSDLVVQSDGYSKHKASKNHNTILINGMGQMSAGRPESLEYSQPSTSGGMKEMGVITAWHDAGPIVGVEGEASGSYLAYMDKKSGASRPNLDRYRRSFIWVKDAYILVLDEIRAPQAVDIDWLIQGPQIETVSENEGRFLLKGKTQECEFQIVADRPLVYKLQDSSSDDRGVPLGYQQLKASAKAPALRVVSVYNPWKQPGLGLRIEAGLSPDETTVIVEGKGIRDNWSWKAGADRFNAATIRGSGTSPGLPFQMDSSNKAPAL